MLFKKTLRSVGCSLSCTEVNWNSIVEQPIRDGRLRHVAVRNLGNALASSSLGGVHLRSRNTRLHPLLAKFAEASFVCAELAEFATFICFAVIAPIVYLLALAIQMEIDSPIYLWGYWHLLLSLSCLVFIAGLVSYVSSISVLSVFSRESSSALESIRRFGILGGETDCGKRLALVGYICIPLISACVGLRVHFERQAEMAGLYARVMSQGAQTEGIIKWSCTEYDVGPYIISGPASQEAL